MFQNRTAAYSVLFLRLTIGGLFITDLYWKFIILGVGTWWSDLEKAGYPDWVIAYAISAEFVGAVLITFGIYARWAALYAFPMMVGATVFSVERKGFYFTAVGYEVPLVWSILLVVQVLAGRASTKVSNETPLVSGVAQPTNILVYDFVGDPNMIPADSVAAARVDPTNPPSPEDVQAANEYGAVIARRLAEDIRAMGMSATYATPGVQPAVGDGVIKGYIVSAESGKAGRRVLLGFGSGKSKMETVVEGYGMTPEGLRPLGAGTVNAESGKMPGLLVPAAVAAAGSPVALVVIGGVKLYNEASGKSGLEGRATATTDEIAAQLRVRFKERGWITGEGKGAS